MDHDHGQPKDVKKDEWGNDYRTFQLMPLQVKKSCHPEHCLDHVTMTYSVEMDVSAVTGLETAVMMMQGQEIPTERRWVPITRVLVGYN
jgi:hypothetical protein